MRKKFDNRYDIEVSKYLENNRLYIGIFEEDGSLHSDVTVNLPEIPLKHDNQIFLSDSLSNSTKEKLVEEGIISKPKGVQQYNMIRCEIADVNFDVLKEYDVEGVEEFLKKNINIKNLFEQYTDEEVKELLSENTRLVYVSNKVNDIVIKYEDIPDVIVDFNDKFGITDLRICDYENPSLEPLITTKGVFLDKCDPDVRADIIDRLIDLQYGEEVKNYKIVNIENLESIGQENKLKKDNQEKER